MFADKRIQGVETIDTLGAFTAGATLSRLLVVGFFYLHDWKAIKYGGDMLNREELPAGPIWGVIAGVLLVAAGVGLGIAAKLLNGSGQFDESLAISATMIGVFLAVYAGHELTRKKRH